MERYTVTRHFRCTKQESEEIDRKAAREKKTISAYLRDAALCRNIPKFDEKTAMILKRIQENELKIGVNINQAVRLCNYRKMITGNDYETLTKYLKMLLDQRKEVINALLRLSKTGKEDV